MFDALLVLLAAVIGAFGLLLLLCDQRWSYVVIILAIVACLMTLSYLF